jgi:hypothetical protein
MLYITGGRASLVKNGMGIIFPPPKLAYQLIFFSAVRFTGTYHVLEVDCSE